MCCAFLSLVLLGPRIFGAFWWIFQPLRWQASFANWAGGSLWWIWPLLGIVFLPWTTLMYVIVAPGGWEVGSGSGLPLCSWRISPPMPAALGANRSHTTKGIE